SAVVLDPAQGGATPAPPPPFLDDLQRAVVAGRQVELGYADREGRESVRTVHPRGLVSTSSVWYLVAGTDAGRRTCGVGRVRAVAVTERRVERAEGFEREAAWREAVEAMDVRRGAVRARARAGPRVIGWGRNRLGRHLRVGERRDDGRVEVEVGAWTHGALAYEMVAFGPYVEVLEPQEVRDLLASFGEELVARDRAESPVTG